MVNRPLFFDTFVAAIRHRDLGDGWSQVESIYQFTARPRWLRWLLILRCTLFCGLKTGDGCERCGRFSSDDAKAWPRRAPI